MIEAHIDLQDLSASQLFSLLMKWWIDDVASFGVSRQDARASIYRSMDAMVAPAKPVNRLPDRETWGLLPEHQDGQERALRLMQGGLS